MAIEPTNPSDPALGADLLITVGSNKRQILRSLAFTFVASADVANRLVRLTIDNGNGLHVYWKSENQVAQTATITTYYNFAPGFAPPVTAHLATTSRRTFSIPEIPLAAGWRIYTETENIQAADAISGVHYILEDVPVLA